MPDYGKMNKSMGAVPRIEVGSATPVDLQGTKDLVQRQSLKQASSAKLPRVQDSGAGTAAAVTPPQESLTGQKKYVAMLPEPTANENNHHHSNNLPGLVEGLHEFEVFAAPQPVLQQTASSASLSPLTNANEFVESKDVPEALETNPVQYQPTAGAKKRGEAQQQMNEVAMSRVKSVHGTTAILAEKQMATRTWNWNRLPLNGMSCLIKLKNSNVVKVEIDGQLKQLQYNVKYNPALPIMDIFYSFNHESKPMDCLVCSKERLKAFSSLMVDSFNRAQILNQQGQTKNGKPVNTLLTMYSKEASDYLLEDGSEIGTVVHLWLLQLQKMLSQTNSLFFSSEILQNLLKRKSLARKTFQEQQQQPYQQQQKQQNAPQDIDNGLLYIQQEDTNIHTQPKPVLKDPIEEIDILVLTTPIAQLTSWQLAFDEPNLDIADYKVNIAPWNAASDDIEVSMKSDPPVLLVSDEKDLIKLNRTNFKEYLTDCMGRPLNQQEVDQETFEGELSDGDNDMFDENGVVGSKTMNTENITSTVSQTMAEPPLKATELNVSLADQHSAPKKAAKKKSSIVNFFRRRHTSSSNVNTAKLPTKKETNAAQIFTGVDPKPVFKVPQKVTLDGLKSEKYPSPAPSAVSSSMQMEPLYQSIWLEKFFGRSLSNFKSVTIPTQYFLPKNSRSPVSPVSSKSTSDNCDEKTKNGHHYNKVYLQLKLPFRSESIPCIFCPWFWNVLSRNKWSVLVQEMYRCLEPEGYALAVLTDLRPTNSDPLESKFLSTKERDNIFDDVAIDAINHNLYIHPTKHVAEMFKNHGFTSIKTSTLSLKLGDLATHMGPVNEFICLMMLNFLFKHNLRSSDEIKNPGASLERYMAEHWNKVDDAAGTFRIAYLVAQKPKVTPPP
ncbi:uncharacterized protein KNAG_0M00760 [Huiozyma naganishii CBS 8797]|uniref:Uncharacterized protein n=1 Tax=Huiozyma naganishii (strain ATCC MYA-139 / BCRC 22969 / CBS 8797 / KCTC 17520 / NBRC 10181 / NCYC 3082 / Yp74L-3) TaxID=1071383 RepID=J7SAP8_HUIN7|nr:hypothetical protein KNAG_0M00760 [Kazachstania naganishii CBS 8797]CCK72929.1 hypothetical protein KNAG_0M00760 [Kazachstania naganishii CBS 8797]